MLNRGHLHLDTTFEVTVQRLLHEISIASRRKDKKAQESRKRRGETTASPARPVPLRSS